MKRVDLDQGTEFWHKWRREGVGASDAAIIGGSSPYQSPLNLWEEKCGLRQPAPTNDAMRHGHECEIQARKWINSQLDLFLEPCCVEDEENPIFRASLDGFDAQAGVLVEIKSPYSTRRLDELSASIAIPSYWYDQIQWQMAIVKPAEAHLAIWDYRVGSAVIRRIRPDLERQQELRQRALQFWDGVRYGEAPEALEGDHPLDDNPGHIKLLELWNSMRTSRMTFEKAEKEYKQQLASLFPQNVECGGYRVTHYAGRKSYDYKQMEADGIDIEAYARFSDPFMQIRPPSKKHQ